MKTSRIKADEPGRTDHHGTREVAELTHGGWNLTGIFSLI
jgi:hypothetical protein